MRLKVLGCSGGIADDHRTTSFLIDDDVLIDAGSGIDELNIGEMASIEHIFLTHSHLDHVAFLPLMVDSLFSRLTRPIVVFALEETIAAVKAHIFNNVIWPDFTRLPSPDSPVIRFESMSPGEVKELAGRKFEMIPVNHLVPGVGYYVEGASGKSMAFSGDTTTNDSFWQALNHHQRLDLLVAECAFPNADRQLSEVSRHYCPALLAADLRKLNHQPELYISHTKPSDEQVILHECREAISDRQVDLLVTGHTFEL